ncbi:peptidase M61 [Antarcticibacterium sp. 1MA-6-2]|uniref:M61 family metallopeptidase n=1 Tax=Antarcticibacterium sp. 1MA-6-2 TaxID=2908210 RepID=UPI001F2B7131|nr:peptidase M61 [Antarcticibacterium sp. 1MA-6-2]UJH91348.1 peptidase M61 [Antarcticibacterium sp. 1MA-6-2]
MKKILYFFGVLAVTYSCKTPQNQSASIPQPVMVNIDLLNIKEDRVMVTVDPDKFTQSQTTFYIPTTVPGTYSIDNYGELVQDVKAYDYKGNELTLENTNSNTWVINNATELDKITYWVNDSFDMEGEKGIFSPSGTNIEKGENFMLNLHGFIGYFDQLKEHAYKLTIDRPQALFPGTAMQLTGTQPNQKQASAVTDTYNASRYFDIIDNPIMYAAPDTASIRTEGINVLLHVYSPNKVYTAQSIKDGVAEMISAQKKFLGEIDNTSNYAILLYLSNPEVASAKGFGALEHHTSTVVVLPETMPLESLKQTMTDVVSHEFFHILTPLNVHSNEIHYFDYNNPQMSQHLWMYEGVTEYFANLFQVNQELIENEEFYKRMSSKIENSKNFDDTVPFTLMSKKILEVPYKDAYYNVYLKGALIGMALDIRLRELSNGEEGILDLMKELSGKYGKNKPFEDEELIPTIVQMTYPEIADFFSKYVTGETPIPYDEFFAKVGVEMQEETINTSYFIKGQTPYIDGNPESGELFFRKGINLNSFLKELGVENGDLIKSVNGKDYNVQNVYELVMASQRWEVGNDITMVVIRNKEEKELKGKITQPTDTETGLGDMDLPEDDKRVQLRKAWLKN